MIEIICRRKFKCGYNSKNVLNRVENIVGNGKKCLQPAFSHSPECFLRLSFSAGS